MGTLTEVQLVRQGNGIHSLVVKTTDRGGSIAFRFGEETKQIAWSLRKLAAVLDLPSDNRNTE